MQIDLPYLPIDIQNQVKEDFAGDEVLMAISLLSCKFGDRKDPRWSAYVLRSAVFLAKGNLNRLIAELKSDDIRSVLLQAEEESGGYGHYFHPTFPEIRAIIQKLNQEEDQHLKDQENLPPEFYDKY
jgi:hypothetical protein